MGEKSEHPLTTFSDKNTKWGIDYPPIQDETLNLVEQRDTDLKDFFRRPVSIASYNWPINGNLTVTFDPWVLYMSNKYIVNRMSNYKFFRGNLKLRFAINGNPMNFGRAIVSYVPLSQFQTPTTLTSMTAAGDITTLSQCPHVFLDPATSEGAEMTLPFVWKYAGAKIALSEAYKLGDIAIRNLSDLRHANGGTDGVRVTVFAWCDDMELYAPTGAPAGLLVPQSGEYEEGHLISRTANAVKAVAGSISDVPVIGKYAKATEMASGAMADVAKMYGYSKPVNQAPIEQYTPRFFGNMANSVDLDSIQSLSLDKKVELSVDPSTIGPFKEDEMSIINVAKKESYIGKFLWTVGQAPGTELGYILNCPHHFQVVPGPPADAYCIAATAFVANMCKYWRGSLKYRFQIVASNFHRGRLLVQYDPYTSLINDENVKYSRVIDIAEEKDFEIEIGWSHERPWLETPNTFGETPFLQAGAFGANTGVDNFNGVVSVSVLNDLTEPSTQVDTLDIHVYVSAGDDFEVCYPIETPFAIQASPWSPNNQSGEVDEEDEDANAPEMLSPQETILGHSDKSALHHVFMGDPLRSLRTILKRYTLADSLALESNQRERVTVTFPGRPFVPGWDPNGIHDTATGAKVNYVHQTPFSLMSLAYRFYRGSFRWKIYLGTPNRSASATAVMRSNTGNIFSVDKLPHSNLTSLNAYTEMFTPAGHSGMVATSTEQNPVLEFAVPWYSAARWTTGVRASILAPGGENFEERGYTVNCINDGPLWVERYFAMGDDALFTMFCGLPRMYDWWPLPVPGTPV